MLQSYWSKHQPTRPCHRPRPRCSPNYRVVPAAARGFLDCEDMAWMNDGVRMLSGLAKVAQECASMSVKVVSSRAPFLAAFCERYCPRATSSDEMTFEEELPQTFVYESMRKESGAPLPSNPPKRDYHTRAAAAPRLTTSSRVPGALQRRGFHTDTSMLYAELTVGSTRTGRVEKRTPNWKTTAKERKVPATRLGRMAAFGGTCSYGCDAQ